jgi:hypothetical protein
MFMEKCAIFLISLSNNYICHSALDAESIVGISNGSYYSWRKKRIQSNVEQQETRASSAATTVFAEPRVILATKISKADGNKILEIKATFPHMGTKQLHLYLIRNHKITYSFRQISLSGLSSW